MANVMSIEKRNQILRLLVEGNSIRGICRLMQTNIPTVIRQLLWAGKHCAKLMESKFKNLSLEHLEADEIWTFVQKKQGRLTVEEKAERSDIGDVYLWTALDQKTKLIPAFLMGKRSADNARRFMMNVAGRLNYLPANPSDDHNFLTGQSRSMTRISTDGFAGYPEAVDHAFGPYSKFGTVTKEYRNSNMAYHPGEMVGIRRRNVWGLNEHEIKTICTSHVERNNLTIRTFMKRFTRLALGFSKKLENLEAAVNLHMAYYNFCWRPGKMKITPAMAANVTDSLWSFEKLMHEIS